MFLVGHLAQLVVQRLGQCRKELLGCQQSHRGRACASVAYLCLARVSLMAGDTDLVEEVVQLANDCRDLLG